VKIPFVGQSVTRLEDYPLVTGGGRFVADIDFPHQIHMRVVRSAHAHGRITAIDTADARALAGVTAIWTAADIADVPPIPFRATKVTGLEAYRQPVLARDIVRYVGEPVAVVFAADAYIAEDAAELIQPDIEALPPLLSAFGDGPFIEPAVIRKGYGDVDAAMATAHACIELTLDIGRHSGVPLETRGAVARYDSARDHLALYGAAKRPHWNRDQLAKMLGRAPSTIDLYEGHVGGGFGIRGELYPEDVLVCLAAQHFKRPVKWIEDRREHLMAANQSREQRHIIRAGIDATGRLLAIEDTFFHDQGAYVRTHGVRVADMTAGLLLGPYRVPNYRVTGHYRLTNKTPAATYRAPGRYESSFVRERLMDAIAARLDLDPVEIRRRNLIATTDMPFARALEALDVPVTLDSGDYAGLLDKALARADWPQLKSDAARRRAAGETVGVGMAMFVEKSGLGPVDGVRIRVDDAGKIEVITGAASLGQGMETVIAQICADALGVDYRAIRVIHGQTDRIEYGFGAHASRVTVMTGEATRIAASKLRDKALGVAAQMLQTPLDTLDIVDGRITPDGKDGSLDLARIQRSLAPGSAILGGANPGLSAEGWFHCDHMTYPYGVHIALVAVDRGTGCVRVEKYLLAYDVGKAVNPMLIEGQMLGGLAQGLGGALFEEFSYDERGQPLSVTFADYLIAGAREMPQTDVLITQDAPSPLNPMGIKGAGEGGITPVGAAIAAAIDDAVQRPGAITRLPVTPQRLHALLGAQ
jgi:carbon-monoxide dehydrogenase large subunit/6-hydroxypseudooxynicotine dehydrogenase subunit gamma